MKYGKIFKEMKIIIGTKNKDKINTTKQVLISYSASTDFEIIGASVESGVPETPYDAETFMGAKNRAHNCFKSNTKADYYIGIESGLVERYGHLYEEAWAVILDKNKKEWYGYSSGLKVPDYVLKKMDALQEGHGNVMAYIESEINKKSYNDTWGTYSGDLILRKVSLEEALRNAIIQCLAPEQSLYKKE